MQEIERKFLVKSEAFKKEAFKSSRLIQGFLNSDKLRTVRVRLIDDKAVLTVKGKSSSTGRSRFEWETEIPKLEAEALLQLCEPGLIDKTRFYVKAGSHTFEVDEFYASNLGLVVAEVELTSEDEVFQKPNWLGEEVTGDVRYYNSMLARHPFKEW
jgi:CYTH domain-containing protein